MQLEPPGQAMQCAGSPQVLGEQTLPVAQQPDQHRLLAVQLHHHCWGLVAPVFTHPRPPQLIPHAPQLSGVLIVVGTPPQHRAR